MDILNSLHILADILGDFQYILVDKYRQADCSRRDIDCLVHREMDCRALLGLILISKDSKIRFNFFLNLSVYIWIVIWKFVITRLNNGIAISERITSESRCTSTCWWMIDYLTNCILTTSSWTRILTFRTYASHIRDTIRIDGTLWTTSFVRISNIVR